MCCNTFLPFYRKDRGDWEWKDDLWRGLLILAAAIIGTVMLAMFFGGSIGYAREELRAGIASMIIGSELGIDYDPDQHAAYAASWIQIFRK